MTELDPGISRTPGKIRVPRLKNATLRNFSLFSNAPTIKASFGNGVFCLAGANGLGKSTFLAALNFGITGIVADPNRKFESVPEYYRYSQSYSSDFFRGRISPKDRDAAEIELEMEVGDRVYRLVRGMFEPVGLRALNITSRLVTDRSDSINNDPALDETERHGIYAQNLTKDAGLKTFAQLVFLQHYVLTFDERRHLIFWDEKVAQSALFIAFGIDPESAGRADILRRNYEKADSLVRNLQWQATDIRKRLEDVTSTVPSIDDATSFDISEQHRLLIEEREAAQGHAARIDSEVQDMQLLLAEASARRDATRAEYESAFRRVLFGRKPPETHPVILESLNTSICAICGTESPVIASEIRNRLDHSRCPLCDSDLSQLSPTDESSRVELERLDSESAQLESRLVEARTELGRAADRMSEAREKIRFINARIVEFETRNEAVLGGASQMGALQGIVEHYRSQIAELMNRKEAELEKRSAARRELGRLQEELTRGYAEAEGEFVPKFTSLAREFLGLDLDVRLQSQVSGAQLVLRVMNNPRRAPDTLSESQRFFIDIALRMALVQYISGPGLGAIYIDTPEGSLDIAYESRAGRMFGLFVDGGYQMIMTANINTSQLLLKLAETCGSSHMRLLRMTEWTSLSEVQSESEGLFDDAYRAIEEALEAGDA